MGTTCTCIDKYGGKCEIPVESSTTPLNAGITNKEPTEQDESQPVVQRRNYLGLSIAMTKDNNSALSGEAVGNSLYKHKKEIAPSDISVIKHKEKAIDNGLNGVGESNSHNDSVHNKNGLNEQDLAIDYVDHHLTQAEEANLKNSLSNNFVFKDINSEVLSLILNELIYFKFDANKIIYREGDEGNYFYVLASGGIEASEKGKFKKNYRPWECFGELSGIKQCKREETVKCLENVEIFTIDGESFRDIQKRINEAIGKERFNFLNTISIFQRLDNISKYNVAQKVKLLTFEPSEKIITRGDIGDKGYIIKEGIVSCRIGSKEVRRGGNNDYFGQNAILIDVKRGCDVFAIQKTSCGELSRLDLKEALGSDYIDVILFSIFKHSIEQSVYFKDVFNDSLLNELYKKFQIKTYLKNDHIFIKGDSATTNRRVIILIEGSGVKVKAFEVIESVAEKGYIMGEDLFKDPNKTLPEDVIAYPDCISFEGEVNELAKIMKIDGSVKKPLNGIHRIGKLKKGYLFKNLSESTLEQIASKFKKIKFNKNDIIVAEGSPGESFYLISKGHVRITSKGKQLRDGESGNCFGEAILISNEKTMRTATVTAIDVVICYVLLKKEFDIIVNDNTIKDYLTKKLALQDTSINLEDGHYIKFLGKGKFGSVSGVHNKKNIYAIKAVSRASVDQQKILAKYFTNERKVMLSLDYPFVVKMVKSMRNNNFCFFLIEYVNGKNLDQHLQARAMKKNIYEVQFYISSMLLMLDYLQKKFIAHRDIKPSNIMIDTNGYLKLIDFGTAKILSDYTSTVIGTPHYIAPEIGQGKGYSLSCDFWSVGICMYEIFYGMYPFGQYASEVIEIYKEVLHKDFFFPSENTKYSSVNNFIKDGLTKKVNHRICNLSILKTRPFFKDFEWDKLLDFKLKPPAVPDSSDLTSFLTQENPYEAVLGSDQSQMCSVKKTKDDYIPAGYDKNWANEF